jgi:uncharacterized protein with FMN-binding domain
VKRLTPVVLVAVLISIVPRASRAEVRTWSDSTGKFQTEAELVDFADGVVRLRKSDGQTISVPLEKLSVADQQFVEAQVPAASEPLSTPVVDSSFVGKEAVVELVSGASSRGRFVSRDDDYVTLEVAVGTRTVSRKYPLDRIQAIRVGGKREVLNEPTPGMGGSGGGSRASTTPSAGAYRSRSEIEQLIDRLGRTPPDWWDSTPLDYPKSLDLAWPQKPPPPWNAQKNVGQYIWEIINPNPNRWREGIRFVHHLLDLHKGNREKRTRAMNTLGRMYCLLLQDYARAAFWWRQAGVDRTNPSPAGVNLAACYWKLGNKQMAMELLRKLPTYYSTIKLLADMGETRTAIQIAEAAARSGFPDMAYLYAGDACRIEGQYRKAVGYYEKVLDVPATGKAKERIERNQDRARANVQAIKIFDALDLTQVRDGAYQAVSPGYAGPLHVEVTVSGGRIGRVAVTQHKEKQFYSALTDTPAQIVEKQGVKGVDAVTGATIPSEAIINATAKALASGIK